MIKIASRK